MGAASEEECMTQRRRRGRRRPRPITRTAATPTKLVTLLLLLNAIEWGPSARAFAPSQLSNPTNFLPALFPSSSSSTATSSSLRMVQTFAGKGLSKYFQAILSRNGDRQRFVTGQYPVIVSVEENPTKRWLNKDRATSMLLVNKTTLDKSLASYDRFQWLDDSERQELHDRYASLSLELLAEIHMPKPGYVQIMSSLGAGASAEVAQQLGSTTRWNRWQNSSLYQDIIMDELLSQQHEEEDEIESDATTLDGTASLANQRLRRDRLWVSGFSLAGRKGIIKSMDVPTGRIESVNARSESMTLWPNEINAIPKKLVAPTATKHSKGPADCHYQQQHHDSVKTTIETKLSNKIPKKQALGKTGSPKNRWDDALLVSDGFLVPGKDQGGIYVVRNPGNPVSEWTVSLTDREGPTSWFYHRAVWVDLTGDGRTSILTARAKLRKLAGKEGSVEETRPKNGELVWLEMPKPHHYDTATGTPLEEDGTEFDPFSSRHLPWKERVLARGPDVMFNVVDMDTSDDTIEVISSQFFDKKVTLHSIKRGPKPRLSFARIIDDRCGSAFGGILADLSEINTNAQYGKSQGTRDIRPRVIDSGSTVHSLNPGDCFSHVLVTSHECNYVESKDSTSSTITDSEASLGCSSSTVIENHSQHQNSAESQLDGGSLFAYKVPEGQDAWKTQPWFRTTVATGFKVNGGLWNVINPGAPGFVYTFHAKLDDKRTGKRPMIAVAGDCAESAYIFRPEKSMSSENGHNNVPTENVSAQVATDLDAKYKLMCEIKCGATVGSIGVGYDNLCSVEQESGYAKLYLPCYEKDKILVFAMGSGEDDIQNDDSGWYEAEPRLLAV